MARVTGAIHLGRLGEKFPKDRLRSAGYSNLPQFIQSCSDVVKIEMRNSDLWVRPSVGTTKQEEVWGCFPQHTVQATEGGGDTASSLWA